MMTDKEMNRLRAKYDRLIELSEAKRLDFSLKITGYYAWAPTLQELRSYINPEWEPAVDIALAHLTNGTD